MATAVASTAKQPARPLPRNTKRPQFPPSDDAPPRLPKHREVTSRYLSLSTSSKSSSTSSTTLSSSISSGSSISSRRSPMIGTRAAITTSKTPQRAVSTERRRPVAETPSSAEKLLVRSVKSQSVSFHGGSYSVPVSKAKPPPAAASGAPAGLSKSTPERRKALATPAIGRRENLLPSDQKQNRWPGKVRADNSSLLTRSLDCGNRTGKLSRSGLVLNDLKRSIVDEGSISKVFRDSNPKNDNEESPGIVKQTGIQRSRASPLSNMTLGSSRLPSPRSLCPPRALSPAKVGGRAASPTGALLRGITSPSRARSAFPEASVSGKNSMCSTPSMLSSTPDVRSGKLEESKVPKKDDEESPGIVKQTGIQRSRASPLSNMTLGSSRLPSPRSLCPPRALSPAKVGGRAASPTGALLRGITSPSRARSAFPEASVSGKNSTCSTPSMLSSTPDVRSGKLGESKVPDAHEFKLLYNRLLQWRLVNAMEDDTMLVQQRTSERSLYNAWLATSKLRHSVTSKRVELQLLRHNLKLYSILEKHEPHLERWGQLERGHYISVSNAIKALESITLRLPVVSGGKADVVKVQEAITSAVDVMQGMGTSVCPLLMKVEQTSKLMSELSKLSVREHQLLDECNDVFSQIVIPLQVIECSLRIHILQLLKESSVKRV